jgi:hypothetical protein
LDILSKYLACVNIRSINKEIITNAFIRYGDMGIIKTSVVNGEVIYRVNKVYEPEVSDLLSGSGVLYGKVYKFNTGVAYETADEEARSTLWGFVELIGKFRREGEELLV